MQGSEWEGYIVDKYESMGLMRTMVVRIEKAMLIVISRKFSDLVEML